MRRLIRMAPGLLALAVPTASWAGLPPAVQSAGQPWLNPPARKPAAAPAGADAAAADPAAAEPGQPPDYHHAPTVDPRSMALMQELGGQVPPPPGFTPDGTCVACQGGTTPPAMGDGAHSPAYVAMMNPDGSPSRIVGARPGPAPTPAPAGGAMMAARGGAPGYAVVGGAPAMAYRGGAPGYAVVGEPGVPMPMNMGPVGEPAPVGVMRAGYRATPGMPPAGVPGAAVAGGGVPERMYPQTPMPFAGPLPAQPSHHRASYLMHFFGLDGFGRYREERESQAREAHSMLTYGAPGQVPSALSSSMVYGR